MIFPKDPKERKKFPVVTGVLEYFPDAIAEISRVSMLGNDQHNPGTELHWDRSKSMDQADAIGRHLIERGTFDADGVRHSARLAWRALAMLQLEIEDDKATRAASEENLAAKVEDIYEDVGQLEIVREELPLRSSSTTP